MHLHFSTTGLIHLTTAVIALLAGTMVLILKKGDQKHKIWGYIYVGSMTVMLITSFMIYRLFNGFGIFHFFSIISTITLAAGMMPLVFKRKNAIALHLSFMYWSVIGLYAALVSEIFTRVPQAPAGIVLFICIMVVMVVANIVWRKKQKHWLTFNNN
ncbi:DUF2306 domain-containing protein [Ascidiimonas sp. W6]|uniref:DUF2306 domain-containing protein n=1 Tax=Ascidiimonas meishanensis TaxID=3128903 RepID=UPI0030EECC08